MFTLHICIPICMNCERNNASFLAERSLLLKTFTTSISNKLLLARLCKLGHKHVKWVHMVKLVLISRFIPTLQP
jgi:hypothetical protein